MNKKSNEIVSRTNHGKYSKYWDSKVRKLAEEVRKKSTVDEVMIEHHISRLIFAMEHDLSDGRELGSLSLNAMSQIIGTFTTESYFQKIHPNTPKEEIDRMKNFAKELKIMMDLGR